MSDQIQEAGQAAKLALLKSIAAEAKSTGNATTIEKLANAYALTIGAANGYLPGGRIEVGSK
ncbi:hypothetical protein [Mycolicibacterium llatzerense]|uniref:hypothetical protein n=1 Tax=Mycolicibacterium llatzerense TaxID=280871 RepID=UPI0021B5A502|nr:hypothetical protein [Mycolicibacterium llatzerense]MCT7367088.1 hypothetical protein [Mycolicibacterium llatzerense]